MFMRIPGTFRGSSEVFTTTHEIGTSAYRISVLSKLQVFTSNINTDSLLTGIITGKKCINFYNHLKLIFF